IRSPELARVPRDLLRRGRGGEGATRTRVRGDGAPMGGRARRSHGAPWAPGARALALLVWQPETPEHALVLWTRYRLQPDGDVWCRDEQARSVERRSPRCAGLRHVMWEVNDRGRCGA